MEFALNTLISEFEDALIVVRKELMRRLKQLVINVILNHRLLIPLITIELVVYALIIVLMVFVFHSQRT